VADTVGKDKGKVDNMGQKDVHENMVEKNRNWVVEGKQEDEEGNYMQDIRKT
jgi:hypothetical protein